MKRIHIGGDSWASGEWCNGNVVHHGVSYFLTACGHDVCNSSKGGWSNSRSIQELTKSVLTVTSVDYVFWIQTDPLRELRPYEEKFKNIFSTYNQLVDKSTQLLDEAYKKLNRLDFPVYCLGGSSKLDIDMLSQYVNLIPFIPSIPQFIYPEYDHPALWDSDWLRGNERQFSITELDLIMLDRKKQFELHRDEYATYFRPDGHHTNREGHKLIYNYMCQELSL